MKLDGRMARLRTARNIFAELEEAEGRIMRGVSKIKIWSRSAKT